MDKDMRFELIKGVYVTEASDVSYNKGKRLNTKAYPQFDRSINGSTYPTQLVKAKIAKINGWAVIHSQFTDDGIEFEVMLNANDTEHHFVSNDEICKAYEWKSFKMSKDGQRLIPKKMA